MLPAALVFLGAGFGGLMRHLVNLAGVRLLGILDFPYATMFINVFGCFLMGALTAAFMLRMGEPWSQPLRLFLTTGVLGGFTTFSTFSLEFAVLLERGLLVHAALYALGSLVLCLVAVFMGLALVRGLT